MIRALSDDRGIAMTEAVAVIPVLILLWMGLIALHHIYAAKLLAQSNAHALALGMAVAGECGSDTITMDQINADSGAVPDLNGDASGMISDVAGCQPFAWSHSVGSAQVTAADIPAVFGGPTQVLESQSMMMCNMKPVDGLVDLVAGLVKGLLGV